jgi:3',5'-cyclic AMP phosphodiesterase CpdA
VRTLVHLSDLHFGRIDTTTLDPLRSAVHAAKPDLVAISGDFTQRARRREFAAARDFLDSIEPPKLVVPGNHDVPYWTSIGRRFFQPLDRYREFISDDLEPEYEDDEMIVVGVNTARSLANGGGRISARQVDRVVTRLAGLPEEIIRVVVTHHPFDLPPGVREYRLLGRARMAMARLSAASADLFLSGHLHLSHASLATDRYRIAGHSGLIVQAGTVSTRSRGEQPSFNLLRIARPDITLTKYVWNAEDGGFRASDWGRYRRAEDGWITTAAV